jgi:hypothetical protein
MPCNRRCNTKTPDAYRAALLELEARWFAPLQKALASGKLRRLRLQATTAYAALAWDTDRQAQWQLWRRPATPGGHRAGAGQGRAMTQLRSRPVSPRVQWQLEQQGLHPLLARVYAGRGIIARSELDYEFSSLLPPARLTHAGARPPSSWPTPSPDSSESLSSPTTTATAPPPARSASGHYGPCGAAVDYLVPNRFTYGLRPVARHRRARREPKTGVDRHCRQRHRQCRWGWLAPDNLASPR